MNVLSSYIFLLTPNLRNDTVFCKYIPFFFPFFLWAHLSNSTTSSSKNSFTGNVYPGIWIMGQLSIRERTCNLQWLPKLCVWFLLNGWIPTVHDLTFSPLNAKPIIQVISVMLGLGILPLRSTESCIRLLYIIRHIVKQS